MKTIKTSDLTGLALDWAVAKCEGFVSDPDLEGREVWMENPDGRVGYSGRFNYSTDWAQGGPIIGREEICTKRQSPSSVGYEWNAWIWTKHIPKGGSSAGGSGPTPLIAAMRCYVASKLGDTVEAPEELL